MSEPGSQRSLPTLRRYLLAWFAGFALLMVIAYTQLLDFYLDLGINLRTQSFLEQTAQDYARTSENSATQLQHERQSLAAYRKLEDLPDQIRGVFPVDDLKHGQMRRRVNVDLDDDNDIIPIDTGNLCGSANCELLYFYTYQLNDSAWLYLVHGIVGTDQIYRELEQTEQAAFAIGGLFTILFLLVTIMGVNSVHGPLRRLENWSAQLGAGQQEQAVPPLRFAELDALAHRLKHAVERMQESVNKEQRFLRHASHELRTPIAILSANLELIDRLTTRADRSEAEQASLSRQYEALADISQLTETLLWIYRQSDTTPKAEAVDLRSEIDTLLEQYQNLLHSQRIDASVEGDAVSVVAPRAAVRILLSNLVRNAAQYTVQGEIQIGITSDQVTIRNTSAPDLDSQDAEQTTSSEYGFGLGLELVSLLCERFGWHYDTQELAGGRTTTVQF